MKKFSLYIIFFVVLFNCFGQEKSAILNLRQIEFLDDEFYRFMSENITNWQANYFETNEIYIVDFFKSSALKESYYITIDPVSKNIESKLNLVAYYAIISDKTFLFSKNIPANLVNVLPIEKNLVCPLVKKDYCYYFFVEKYDNCYTPLRFVKYREEGKST